MEKKMDLTRMRGFTLIELLFALGIFSIGILGVVTMQVSATSSSNSAGKATSNMTWAVDRVEKLMALPYGHANLSAGNHSVTAGNLTPDSDGIDNDSDGEIDEVGETGNLAIQWIIINDMPMLRTKTLQVIVTRTGRGRDTTVALTQVIPEII